MGRHTQMALRFGPYFADISRHVWNARPFEEQSFQGAFLLWLKLTYKEWENSQIICHLYLNSTFSSKPWRVGMRYDLTAQWLATLWTWPLTQLFSLKHCHSTNRLMNGIHNTDFENIYLAHNRWSLREIITHVLVRVRIWLCVSGNVVILAREEYAYHITA